MQSASKNLIDGTRIQFATDFSDQIDGLDALKINNSGENLSILRKSNYMSVERRLPVTVSDTLHYALYNMRPEQYELKIIPSHWQLHGLKAYLVDRFLQTKTEISTHNETSVPFQVTNVPGSSMLNRFCIVFGKVKKTLAPFVENGENMADEVAKADITKADRDISVYPNPLGADKLLNINFQSKDPGNYIFELTNTSGALMQKQKISYLGGNQTVSLKLSSIIVHGNYTVTISQNTHTKTSFKIVY